MKNVQTFHKLLARQIKKTFGEADFENTKLIHFLEIVNQTYLQYDEEKDLIERTMELSSQELTDSLEKLRTQQEILENTYHKLKDTKELLAETEKIAQIRKEAQEEIEQKNNALQASEEELRVNIEELQATQEEIQAQKENLERTLHELEHTQTQLVHAEKMAALGQLVANIAHEINTPLGAIRSSIESIQNNLETTLLDLSVFLRKMTEEEARLFYNFINTSVQKKRLLSSKEERQAKRTLKQELAAYNLPDIDLAADILVDMGMQDEAMPYLPILQNTPILHLAYRITSIQQSAKNITTATDRVSKIIFALKNFSRHDENSKLSRADVNENIETVLTIYQSHLKRGVELIRKFGDIPPFMFYPDELMQVWTNLLHNALQAMNNQGTITIVTELQENQVLISMSDTGHGIPEAIQDKIFQAFFTTKQAGEGSGLGLDIVRKIVERHSGKIYFESTEGVGTTFFVEIPFLM